jgi:DNA-binding NarL/FixJ family response regulator
MSGLASRRIICAMHTVVVVDDHEGFRTFARAFLAAEGFEVLGEAEDARSAVAEVRRLRPDVVLLDVQLPDGDGFEVTRRLLRDARPPAIVLISTREAADYGDRIAACGARGFLLKSELTGPAVRALLP